MKKHLSMWCIVLATAACGDGSSVPEMQPLTKTQNTDAERWSQYDNPELFGERLEYSLKALPTSGTVSRMPWVGSYWPMAYDSINFQWAGAGTESAPHKYGRAFGLGGVEDAVSRQHGVDAVGSATCYYNGQCRGWGEVCARRAGYAIGRCIPGWWGLCHAWATASIMQPEPLHPVVKNGVEFRIPDLKALMTVVYHTPAVKQVSLRCDIPTPNIPYDRAGRPIIDSCRDANPGTFHVLLANYLGLKGVSFIEDRAIGQDVWNQPLRGFTVRTMRDVSSYQANQLLHVGNREYPYNSRAARLVYVMTDVQFIRESLPNQDGNLADMVDQFTAVDRYEYILEIDGAGNIMGGEWLGSSKSDHPDFLWLPTGTQSNVAGNGTIQYENVMGLVRASQ